MTSEGLFVKKCAEFWILLLCIFLADVSDAASNCFVSATGVNFGNYDVFSSTPLDSTGSITVTCSAPWPMVTISISPSASSGTFNPRWMRKTGGQDQLAYNVFTDASMSAIWGDGISSGTQVVVHDPSKKTVSDIIYARLFPGQDVSAGIYSDALTVIILW